MTQVYTLRLVVHSTDDPDLNEFSLCAHTHGGGLHGLELARRCFPSSIDRVVAFKRLLAHATHHHR